MRFLRNLLAGVGAEFRDIFGVVPLLRRPFWIAWGLGCLLALVGLLPGTWAVFAQLVILVGLGVAGLFSGTLAKRVRRRKWVEFPDGPEVAPYLPQLITLLIAPPYFLAMLVLFHQAAADFSGILPTVSYWDAFLLALDNFVRTKVFFDAAACFHLRFGSPVESPAGRALVFVSRFLLDLVFIKLAFQLLNAAWFRAKGLGRGQDLLYSIKGEIAAGDVPRVKELCQEVGDSLRDAVDTLRGYYEPEASATGTVPGHKSAMAWRCLVTMKDYAVPYLKTRHRAATGEERERIAKLIDRLENAAGEPEKPPSTRPWPVIVLALFLALGFAASFLLTGPAGLGIAVLMTLLTSWMLAGSRGWIDRLVRWHVLAPSTPNRLAWLQLGWALCLFPFLIVAWSRFFQLAADLDPTIFSGAAPGELNFPSTLMFAFDNLLHLQIFVDVFKIYGVHIADLRQEGFVGGLLTFLLRLALNVGVIELAVSFGMVWFNRVFRKFAVSPNAELALRQEADECGPQAAVLVGYYLREVREFLVEQMKQKANLKTLMALAASGFLKNAQERGPAEQDDALARTRMALGNALFDQGWLDEAVTEHQGALEIRDGLVREGRDELREDLALTRTNLGNVFLKQARLKEAVAEFQAAKVIQERLVREGREDIWNDLSLTRVSLGVALSNQGRFDKAVVEYQGALEIRERLVREGRVELRDDLATTRTNLGVALSSQGRLEEAIAEYQAAREIRERLVREGREDVRNDLAGTRMGLGNALLKQSRLEEAAVEFQAAREIQQRLVREGRYEFRNDLAMTRNSLGIALSRRGQLRKAVIEFQAAQEIFEELVREGRDDLREYLAGTRMNLGNALEDSEGIPQYQAAREIYQRLVGEGRDDLVDYLARTRMNLGNALFEQGRMDEAVAEFQAARELQVRLIGDGRDDVREYLVGTLLALSKALKGLGQLEEGLAEFQAAMQIRAATGMKNGVAFCKKGQMEEGVAEFRTAREIYERLVNDGRYEFRYQLALTRGNLAMALMDQGRLEEAVTEYLATGAIFERLVAEGHDNLRYDLAKALAKLGDALLDQSRLEEEIAAFRRAIVIRRELVGEGRDEMRYDLACVEIALGAALCKEYKNLEEAVRESQDALGICDSLIKIDWPNSDPARTPYYLTRAQAYRIMGDNNPTESLKEYNAAAQETNKGCFQLGVQGYKKAFELDPNFLWAPNNLAWLLATCPDYNNRNGKEAIRFASYACEKSEWKCWSFIDTLSAAYAEAGDFLKAISNAENAKAIAPLEEIPEIQARIDNLRQKLSPRKPQPGAPQAVVPSLPINQAYVTFACFRCKKLQKVDAGNAGKKAKCIGCGAILAIPVVER